MKTKHTKKVVQVGMLVLTGLVLFSLITGSGSLEATSSPSMPSGYPSAVSMATDMYLWIDGVPGESTDDRHRDWIDIVSFDSKVSTVAGGTQTSGGGSTGTRPEFAEITVGKVIDKATPKLSLHCCNGRHIPEVIIELCRAMGEKQVYMKYTLQDVIVSAVGPVTVDPSNQLEQVSFRFGRIEWEYTLTDPDGSPGGTVQEGWDLAQNRAM
ncbi:MAG: Hcp family type VI secretion system effector [Planctomycetota bacterium]|jgi:type VI secretion system secreted protein Hcp